MSSPRKLLAPGEEIASETNPHWSLLVPRIALAVVIDAAGIALVLAWHSAPLVVGWIILAIGLLALLAVVAKLISWRSTDLVITTRRVIYRTGVIHRFGREIPIDRIQDVTYRQTLLERILGAGSLTVESADERHPHERPSLLKEFTN